MGGAAPRRRDTSRENTAINSDGKHQGIAPGDEDQGPKDLDALTTADGDSDHETGAAASSETDGPGDPESGPDAPDQGNGANGKGSEEPPVTTQMPAIDAAAPAPGPEAGPAAPEAGAEPGVTPPPAEEPALAGPPAPGAPDAEPPVTTQMPKIDAPPPIPDPVVPSGERPAAFPSGERPAAFPSGERPAAFPSGERPAAGAPLTTAGTTIASGERSAAYASGESPAAGGPSGERPRHMRSGAFEAETGEPGEGRREIPKVLALVVPGVVLALLVVAWAVDTATHSGQVLSNVELAGTSIDGTKEDELPGIVSGLAEDMAARKVTLTSGDLVYETTAGALGLKVDESATVDAAMDAGRGSAIFVRPFQWIGSFFSAREVDLDLTVTEATTAETLQRLQGADHTQPTEPSIELTAEGFQMKAGQAGVGIDPEDVATDLRRAAEASPEGAIEIDAEPQDRAPTFTDQQAQELADRANEMTANGISLKAGDTAAPVAVPAATLRGWLSQTVTDGQLDLAFNAEAATLALPGLMAGVAQEPKNATVRMAANGQPEVVPHEQGVTCCGENSADLIWQALRDEQAEVPLEATVAEPEWTTEEVQGWGIVGPVGGNRGWQSGQELTSGQPAGFTTYHPAGETRNINIEKIADDVRGAVVPPGGEFSINDHVGTRTYAKGYVDSGAISGGLHVQEVGGGISQFATTMFNAAFFAGFDILAYQTHSEHFNRYPPGREATMGPPASGPDLRFRNTSPYGVLIWTSYTPTSITVTFYSSPHATAEQTGITEVAQGVCRVVTTTRTVTFPDGHTEQDTFKSQPYRPEGKRCDGSVILPPAPPPGTTPPPTG